MKRDELEVIIREYERVIDAMQGYVIFVQDDEGILRRRIPPKRHFLRDSREGK